MTALDTAIHDDAATPPAFEPACQKPAEPGYSLIKRNGRAVPFDQSKIAVALTKVFLAVEGNKAAASRRVHEIVAHLTQDVVAALTRVIEYQNGGALSSD